MSRLSTKRRYPREAGMTLLELIIATTILLILSSAALPIARFTIVREREKELPWAVAEPTEKMCASSVAYLLTR